MKDRSDLAAAKNFLRSAMSVAFREKMKGEAAIEPDNFVRLIAETLSEFATDYDQRTGNHERASRIETVARQLKGI